MKRRAARLAAERVHVGRREVEDADSNPPLWWEEALLNIEQYHALIELDVTPDPFPQPALPGPETE